MIMAITIQEELANEIIFIESRVLEKLLSEQ